MLLLLAVGRRPRPAVPLAHRHRQRGARRGPRGRPAPDVLRPAAAVQRHRPTGSCARSPTESDGLAPDRHPADVTRHVRPRSRAPRRSATSSGSRSTGQFTLHHAVPVDVLRRPGRRPSNRPRPPRSRSSRSPRRCRADRRRRRPPPTPTPDALADARRRPRTRPPTPTPTPTPSPTPSPTPICFPPIADFTLHARRRGKKKKTDFQFTDLSTTGAAMPAHLVVELR